MNCTGLVSVSESRNGHDIIRGGISRPKSIVHPGSTARGRRQLVIDARGLVEFIAIRVMPDW
jgi:hypothetical protein